MPYLILGVVAGVVGAKFLYSLPAPRAFAFRLGDKLESVTGVAPIVAVESEIEAIAGSTQFAAENGRELD